MTIPNRDEQHGGLEAVGGISRRIKDIMQLSGRNWHRLTPGEQEALDIIAHKIGRILSGADPHDPEHWRDVAGYAVAARRGDGNEQPVNRWRNDREPGEGDAGADGSVWTWCDDESRLAPIRSARAWWNADPTNHYWAPGAHAPGHLPAPPHPPQP